MSYLDYVYCPEQAHWEKILVGRRVVEAVQDNENEGRLVLDNGQTIKVRANEGCGGCSSGWYWIERIASVDNVITSVREEVIAKHDENDRYYDEAYTFHIYVITAAGEVEMLTIDGDDGNGYYGSGYSIELLEV